VSEFARVKFGVARIRGVNGHRHVAEHRLETRRRHDNLRRSRRNILNKMIALVQRIEILDIVNHMVRILNLGPRQ
jgi:hypothetical protein